jgi:hypothetical protein
MMKTDTSSGLEERISFRLPNPLHARFLQVQQSLRRSKTSVVLECLEIALPKIHRRYRK